MPQLKVVVAPQPAVLPITGKAARIRQNLKERRAELAEYDEVGAIDVTAAMLSRLGDEFFGGVPAIAADRTPRYRHKQLDGEHSLPAEDLVYTLLTDPMRTAPGLSIAVEAAGFAPLQLRASSPLVGTTGEETAETIHAFGAAAEAWARAVADGGLDRREAAELLPHVDRLLNQVLDWRTALRRAAGEGE